MQEGQILVEIKDGVVHDIRCTTPTCPHVTVIDWDAVGEEREVVRLRDGSALRPAQYPHRVLYDDADPYQETE